MESVKYFKSSKLFASFLWILAAISKYIRRVFSKKYLCHLYITLTKFLLLSLHVREQFCHHIDVLYCERLGSE